MNKPPDMSQRDSHKVLSCFSCQTNGDAEIFVAVFDSDVGTSIFLKKFQFFLSIKSKI